MITASLKLPDFSDQPFDLQTTRRLRFGLPFALFVLATGFEIWEHLLEDPSLQMDSVGVMEVLFFGLMGPLAIFASLTYVERLMLTLHRAHSDIAVLNRDLERKVAERTAELQEVNLQLRETDQMKSDFVSLVSHELRTPLATLNGGLELALQHEAQLPPKAQRILHLLLDETERLTTFVQSILDVAQLETGRLQLNCGPVAIKPVLNHAADLVFGPGETRVVWHIPADIPPVWVDEVYTEQAIRNLLRNAEKYSPPESPIIVEVRVNDERQLCVCVTDFGPGIPFDQQEQVFARFARLAQGTGDRPPGWGLGLHFARVMIAAQGGVVTVQSPVHVNPATPGSRFVVTLPIAAAQVSDTDEAMEAEAAGHAWPAETSAA